VRCYNHAAVRRRVHRRSGRRVLEESTSRPSAVPQERGAHAQLLQLQRTHGNQAVCRLISRLRDGETDSAEQLNRNGEGPVLPDIPIITKLVHQQVNLEVHHSARESDLGRRLAALLTALSAVIAAGFDVPKRLKINLAKQGRGISTEKLCAGGGSAPKAHFNPPDVLHLSGNLGPSPIDGSTGGTARLDPKDLNFVIHQLGHFLHFARSPGAFYSLSGAEWKEFGIRAAGRVSPEATANPREFVAEVFVGLVLGHSFSDEVLALYDALGGPVSGKYSGSVQRAKKKIGELAQERKKKAAPEPPPQPKRTGRGKRG
jgi:hypothetical protein